MERIGATIEGLDWINLRRPVAGPALPAYLQQLNCLRTASAASSTMRSGWPAIRGVDRVISDEAKRKTPPVLHPLVHQHPVTGGKAPYLDSTTTIGIEGMDDASGSALLDEIYAFATRPEFVYCHHWQDSDVVLWDNGFTIHRREPFDPAARRLMKRTTIFLSRERHIVPEGILAAAA